MEKDIVDELVKRDMEARIVKRYLCGCYQQLICGNTAFNLNLLSTKRKASIAALVQGGASFSDAFTNSRANVDLDNGDITVNHVTLRPAGRDEDASEYLDYINERVKDFLAKQGIRVVDGFHAVKKSQRHRRQAV
jgi:hypothetical protein